MFGVEIAIRQRENGNVAPAVSSEEYTPRIRNAEPRIAPDKMRFGAEALYRVRGLEGRYLVLDTGLKVDLLGVTVVDESAYQAYVQRYLMGRQVSLRYDKPADAVHNGVVRAYVYLKNKIFVNGYLLKAGIARPTPEAHRLQKKFQRWWEEREISDG